MSSPLALRADEKHRRAAFEHLLAAEIDRHALLLIGRLASAIEVDDGGCWLWQRGKRNGYGQIRVNGATRNAHRVTYELLAGTIAAGDVLDHRCGNGGCVNPDHLEPVSHQENILRGAGLAAAQATATHCPQGHPYDAENTYVLPSRPNARYCRACSRERRRARRLRKRAAS